jgi:serine/threonine-protein kinase
VCDVPDEGRGGTWSQDGTIVFAGGRSTGLSRIASSGGNPEPLTKPDAARAIEPSLCASPDAGISLLRDAQHGSSSIFCASDTENRLLVEGASNGAYAQGHLLFVQRSTLFAQPFDPGKGRLEGKPIALADGVGSGFGVTRAMFSASADGTLVYVRKPAARRSSLEWLDRAGKQLGNLGPPMEFYDAVLSPDGKKLAVDRHPTDQEPLGSRSFLGTRTRLTFGPTSGPRVVAGFHTRGLPPRS